MKKTLADDNLLIGANIRRARTLAGFTLDDLAKRLNISYSYLSLIERGHRSPDAVVVMRLAELLNIKVEELLARPAQKTIQVSSLDQVIDASVAIFDSKDRLVHANDQLAKLLGYQTAKQVLGMTRGELRKRHKVELDEEGEQKETGLIRASAQTLQGQPIELVLMRVKFKAGGDSYTRTIIWEPQREDELVKRVVAELRRQS